MDGFSQGIIPACPTLHTVYGLTTYTPMTDMIACSWRCNATRARRANAEHAASCSRPNQSSRVSVSRPIFCGLDPNIPFVSQPMGGALVALQAGLGFMFAAESRPRTVSGTKAKATWQPASSKMSVAPACTTHSLPRAPCCSPFVAIFGSSPFVGLCHGAEGWRVPMEKKKKKKLRGLDGNALPTADTSAIFRAWLRIYKIWQLVWKPEHAKEKASKRCLVNLAFQSRPVKTAAQVAC